MPAVARFASYGGSAEARGAKAEAQRNPFCALGRPAGLDRAIVAKLHDGIVAILTTPDMQERIKTIGYDVIASTPEEFGAQTVNDVARWGEVVGRRTCR